MRGLHEGHGAGVPFNRIELLQDGLGVPLPASTQWGLVDRRAEALTPVFDALVRHAAQGEVLHNDDTSVTVLELWERTREEPTGRRPIVGLLHPVPQRGLGEV